MPDSLTVLFLVVAIVIGLVFVPLGWSAAVFIVYKVAPNLRKWTRYFMEIHTALLAIIAGAMIVPMQLVTNILSIASIPIPIGLELAELLTMRICQGVMIVSVVTITMKRVRTMTQGNSSHSKSMEIGSILLAWAVGLSIGIGTTYRTARDAIIFNQTSKFEDGRTASRLACWSVTAGESSEDYFSAVHIGLLLMTSLVILGGCVSVTRHIQSSIRGTTLVGVYRIDTLARGLKDNLALEYITANGRKATMISGNSQDLGSSRVFVDNWVSEQPSLRGPVSRFSVSEPKLSILSSSSAFPSDSGGLSEFRQTPRPRSSALMCSPVSTRKNVFEAIEERESEVDISIFSDEVFYETMNVEFLRTNSAHTIISRELRSSSLPSLSISCDYPSPLHSSQNSFQSSVHIDGLVQRPISQLSNQSATASMSGIASSWGRQSTGGNPRPERSTTCLPPLKHTRASPSAAPLERNLVLSAKTSIQSITPSSLSLWPSLERVLSLCATSLITEARSCTAQSSLINDSRQGDGIVQTLDERAGEYGRNEGGTPIPLTDSPFLFVDQITAKASVEEAENSGAHTPSMEDNEHEDMFSQTEEEDVYKTGLNIDDTPTRHTDSTSKCSDQNSSKVLVPEAQDNGAHCSLREDYDQEDVSSLRPAGDDKNGHDMESTRTSPPVDSQSESLDQNSSKALASESTESGTQSSPSEDNEQEGMISLYPAGVDKYDHDKESTRSSAPVDNQSHSLDSSNALTYEAADNDTQFSSSKDDEHEEVIWLHPAGVGRAEESAHTLPPVKSQYLDWKPNTYLGKQQKEELNELKKCLGDNDCANGHTVNVEDIENPPSTKTVAPAPVQIRVMRPSTEVMRYLHRKNGYVQCSDVLKLENETGTKDVESNTKEVHPASRAAINTSTSADLSMSQRHSTGSMNVPRRCSIQLPQRLPPRLPIQRRDNSRYTKKVIKRFVLAFVVNIVTQIPYAALQMAKVDCQTFKTVQPFLQSIALITFAVSPYAYILGNKVIHKQLIGPRRR